MSSDHTTPTGQDVNTPDHASEAEGLRMADQAAKAAEATVETDNAEVEGHRAYYGTVRESPAKD